MYTSILNALKGAVFAHHNAFIELDGQDPNWHTWYAQWLLTKSEISELLETHFNIQTLSQLLQQLKGSFNANESPSWEAYYAQKIYQIIKIQE